MLDGKRPKVRLIVIDVSADVMSRGKKSEAVLDAVLRSTDSAMSAGDEIFVLSYKRGVAVDERLVERLSGYAGRRYIPRAYPDGAPEIVEAIADGEVEVFRLCGTFADACVAATAWGLAEAYPSARIEVVTDACISVLGKLGWSVYLQPDSPANIVLVRENGVPVTNVREIDIPLAEAS